jgi:hypothetical protein
MGGIMKLKITAKHSCIAMIFFVFGFGLFYDPAAAVASGEADMYAKIEYFTWKEYDDYGARLLEESGPILGFGVAAKSDMNYSFTLKCKGELFGGLIDYDGLTLQGMPFTTDTEYFGFKVESDLGRKFMIAKRFSLEPFAGLGYRRWSREIQSTSFAFGYKETWWTFYGRLGLQGDLVFTDQLTAFADGGIKVPIRNENEVDFRTFGLSTITVEPGNEVSYFAEAGLRWRNLKSSVYYEGMRFSKSALDEIFQAVYQPESKADIFGISIGLVF